MIQRIDDAQLPRRRVGAACLFVDREGSPLMVEPTCKPTWEIPGGVVEDGEDPRTCVTREVDEELGLTLTPGRLLVIDHQTEPPPRGDSMCSSTSASCWSTRKRSACGKRS